MSVYQFIPEGVCARKIEVEIENGIVRKIAVEGGCHGNLQGIAALCQDLPAVTVISKLKGIRCLHKETSCPDQIALCLAQAISSGGHLHS